MTLAMAFGIGVTVVEWAALVGTSPRVSAINID